MTWAMRARLPNRHSSEFFSIEAMALRFSVSASRYPDGRLGAPCARSLCDNGVTAVGNDMQLQSSGHPTSFFHRCFKLWTCQCSAQFWSTCSLPPNHYFIVVVHIAKYPFVFKSGLSSVRSVLVK